MCSTGQSLFSRPPSPLARPEVVEAGAAGPRTRLARRTNALKGGGSISHDGWRPRWKPQRRRLCPPFVHREIQQHRAQSFSLAGMRRHGICRHEGQLAVLDLQDLFLALVVQVPRQLLRLDWIQTSFVNAVQLSSGAFEFDVDD